MADGQMGGYDVNKGPMVARAGAEVQKWEREKVRWGEGGPTPGWLAAVERGGGIPWMEEVCGGGELV